MPTGRLHTEPCKGPPPRGRFKFSRIHNCTEVNACFNMRKALSSCSGLHWNAAPIFDRWWRGADGGKVHHVLAVKGREPQEATHLRQFFGHRPLSHRLYLLGLGCHSVPAREV
eukprot:5993881-Pyramimonas_sp.AAC.1